MELVVGHPLRVVVFKDWTEHLHILIIGIPVVRRTRVAASLLLVVDTMLGAHVTIQQPLSAELSVTHLAAERLFSCVCTLMLLEIERARVHLLTEPTFEGLTLSVSLSCSLSATFVGVWFWLAMGRRCDWRVHHEVVDDINIGGVVLVRVYSRQAWSAGRTRLRVQLETPELLHDDRD